MTQTIRLKVREKVRETHRAITLVFEPLDGPLRYRAGQFLTFLFDDLGPRPLRRSYSLSTAPGVDDYPAVTVKKQVNGLVSRYLHDIVQSGDILHSLLPAGKFILPEKVGNKKVMLFGGGSGVTPLFGLLKDLLHHHPDSKVLLVDANSGEKEIIFRKKLTQYNREFKGRFKLLHYLSNPLEDLTKLRAGMAPAKVRWGRLGNALMEKIFTEFADGDPEACSFYLCGPPDLLLKVREVLGFLGFGDEQIHRELFLLSQPFRPPAELYPDCKVELRQRGRKQVFNIEAGKTILEGAELAGYSLPYSCRSGSCTTCVANCLSGNAEMYTPDGRMDAKSVGGDVLTCVAYPLTKKMVLEVGTARKAKG